MDFAEIRGKYPQYGDLSDEQLARGLHEKFYSDMPFEDFSSRIGYKSTATKAPAAQPVDPFAGQSNMPGDEVQQAAPSIAPIDTSRPIVNNQDGSFSTERTITVEADGKHYLLPTIIEGTQVSPREATDAWAAGKNPHVGVYDTPQDAESAAVARSQRIGEVRGAEARQPPMPAALPRHEQLAAEQPARMTMSPSGGPRVQPPDETAETGGFPGAQWVGEGGVLTNSPAGMVAAGKNAIANLQRATAEENAVGREEALGTQSNPLGYRISPKALERQKQGLEQARQAGEAAKQWAESTKREMALVTPQGMDTTQQAVWSLVQSAPPTVLGIGVGIATRNPVAAMAIAGGGGSAFQAGSTYGEARDKGAPHRIAAMAASIDGVLEGVGESIPLAAALKPGSPFMVRLANTIWQEAGQEGLTQLAQDFNAYLSYDPNITLGKAWQNFKVAMLAGAMGGAVYGAAGHAVEGRGEPLRAAGEPVQTPQPEQTTSATPPVVPVTPVTTAPPPPEPPVVTRGALERALVDERPATEIVREEAAQEAAQRVAPVAEAVQQREEQRAATTTAMNLPQPGESITVSMPTGPITGTVESTEPTESGWDLRLRDAEGELHVINETDNAKIAPAAAGEGTPASPVRVEASAQVDHAAARADTEPTEGQKEAGNYRKGHVNLDGLQITIENPKGSERTGTDSDGERWSVTMPAHYGYVKRSEGADGDQVDVYVGEAVKSPRVIVIDQINPETGQFDEHKALLGFQTPKAAIDAYIASFSDGRGALRIGAATPMNVEGFKQWLKSGDTKKPLKYVQQELVSGATPRPSRADAAQTESSVNRTGVNAKSTSQISETHPAPVKLDRGVEIVGGRKAAGPHLDAVSSERRLQSAEVAVHLVRGLAEAHPALINGFGALDVDAKRLVQTDVLRAIHDDKVFDAVVSLVPVDVVNDLMGTKFPANRLLHQKAMLERSLATMKEDEPVVGLFIDSLIGGSHALETGEREKGGERQHTRNASLVQRGREDRQLPPAEHGEGAPGGGRGGVLERPALKREQQHAAEATPHAAAAQGHGTEGAAAPEPAAPAGEPARGQPVQPDQGKSPVRLLEEQGRDAFLAGPKASVRRGPVFAHDEIGRPLLSGNTISLVDPGELGLDFGVTGGQVFQHKVVAGTRVLGTVTLLWDGKPGAYGKVRELWHITTRPKLRGLGIAEDVVRTILEHNGAKEIRALSVLPKARGFWENMGATFEEQDDGEDGFLTLEKYREAAAARAAEKAAGRGTGEPAGAAQPEGRKGPGDAGSEAGDQALDLDFTKPKSAIATADEIADRGLGRQGLSPEQVRARLIEAFGPGIDVLMQDGILHIVAEPSDLPARLRRATTSSFHEAWYDPKANGGDGEAYIIAKHMRPGRVVPVMLHEIGEHYGLPRMLGGRGYAALLREVRALHARGTSAAVEDAWQYVKSNYGRISEESPNFVSEVIASVGESAAGRELPFFQRVLQAVRTFLTSIGLKLDLVRNLTDEDLRILVEAAARRAVRRSAEPAPVTAATGVREPMAAINEEQTAPDVNPEEAVNTALATLNDEAAPRRELELNAPGDRRWIGDISLFTKLALHPRMIAALERSFVPVYRVAEAQFEDRDQIAHALASTADPYFQLTDESKQKVNAALELDRLEGTVHLRGEAMTVENDGRRLARLSKPGDRITLNADEKSAYWAVRHTMDMALKMFRDQTLEELGIDTSNLRGHNVAEQILEAINPMMSDAEKALYQRAAEFAAEIEQARRRGYIPFTRWGNVVITVKDGSGNIVWAEKVEVDPVEIGGGRVAVRAVSKVREMPSVKKALANVERLFPGQEVNVFQVPEGAKIGEQIPGIAQLDALAALAGVDPNAWDQVRDQLEKALKAKGFRKHFINSKNVPGYSGDLERAIADYITGISGYLARRKHADAWQTALGDIPATKPRLKTYAEKYQQYLQSPQEERYLLRQIGFMYYLAGVPASAIANLTQVPLVAAPYLAQFTNPAAVTAQLARANADVALMYRPVSAGMEMFDPKKAPEDVRAALAEAWARGFFVPLQTYEVQGVAFGRTPFGRKTTRTLRDVRDGVAYLFTLAERTNRLVTFIAAYRLASRAGFQARADEVLGKNQLARSDVLYHWSPLRFAEWTVDETQFRMGKVNRPEISRGWGTSVMQFKGFMMQMLELWYRMASQNGVYGKAGVAASLLLFMLVAGVWGLPGAEDLRDLWEKLHKMFTHTDFDAKTKLREWVTKVTGSAKIAEMFSRGAPAGAGFDLSGRVGMGNLAPDSPLQVGGIPADITLGRAGRAVEYAANDQQDLAWAEALPNAIKNLITAASWLKGGVRNRKGDVVVPKEQVSIQDAILRGIVGVTPTWISNRRDLYYAQHRVEAAVNAKRDDFYEKVAKARADLIRANRAHDPEAAGAASKRIREVKKDLADYNKDRPIEERIELKDQTIERRVERELKGGEATRGKGRKAASGREEQLRDVYDVR